jgi:hypothetical protein
LLFGAARAETPRVTGPLVHENVAVYLLRGKSADGAVPLTLKEALERNAIVVHETGSVRELRIENTGSEPVFVQLGDIVKGGRQDRVLTISLLLQPNSGLVPIGAYCVEQGRWAARGKEDSHRFALSEAILPSRGAKLAIAKPQAPAGVDVQAPHDSQTRTPRTPIEAELEGRRRAQLALEAMQQRGQIPRAEQRALLGGHPPDNQAEVWRKVEVLQRGLSDNLAGSVVSERSRTSLQLTLEHEKLKAAQEAYVAALEPAGLRDDDVIGVAVAIGGRITGADVYPSNGLFRKMWPKLVRAAATEALAESRKTATVGKAPAIADVEAFLTDGANGKPVERSVGSLARIETREADRMLRVRALASPAPGARLVHESYLAK